MKKFLTVVIRICLFGIIAFPFLSLVPQLSPGLSLSFLTSVCIALTWIGGLCAWQRVLYEAKLAARLPKEVEVARRKTQSSIFPESRLLGWNGPRITQADWDKCIDSNKSVASLLVASQVKNLPIVILLILAVTLEVGVFRSFISGSSLVRMFPFVDLPFVRATEISLLCFTLIVLINLFFCKNSAKKMN